MVYVVPRRREPYSGYSYCSADVLKTEMRKYARSIDSQLIFPGARISVERRQPGLAEESDDTSSLISPLYTRCRLAVSVTRWSRKTRRGMSRTELTPYLAPARESRKRARRHTGKVIAW